MELKGRISIVECKSASLKQAESSGKKRGKIRERRFNGNFMEICF
jgi:hypothetical protein